MARHIGHLNAVSVAVADPAYRACVAKMNVRQQQTNHIRKVETVLGKTRRFWGMARQGLIKQRTAGSGLWITCSS